MTTDEERPKRMAHVELQYVTVAFCDLVASTEQAIELAPEVWAARLDAYFDVVEKVMVDHGGRVEKFIGDAVCAIFSADHAGQRAAPNALRAAHAAIEQLGRDDLSVRVGLSTGYAAINDRSSTFAVGPSMNLAARLQNHAGAGEVIVDAATWELVSQHVTEFRPVTLDLKGVDGPTDAFVVDGLMSSAGAQEGHRLVGRRYELSALDALVGGAPKDVTVAQAVGPPGVGKTHLVLELVRRRELRGEATLVLHHDPYVRESGLFPLYQLAEACRDSPHTATISVAARSCNESSGSESSPAHRVEDVWREVVASLDDWLGARSLLVVQDDHAGTGHVLLELPSRLKPLVQTPMDRSVVVLRVTRDRDETVPSTFVVPPMTEAECLELIDQVTPEHRHGGGHDLYKVSGGNPLFVVQLARHGAASSPGTAPLATLEAVMAERLATLPSTSKSLLLLISASGGRLHLQDLELCLDADESDDVLSAVDHLVEHDMVHDPDDTYGRLVLSSTSLGHVVQRRATRASLAAKHRQLALLWRTRRSRRSAHAEVEAGHWLAHLRARQMTGASETHTSDDVLVLEAVAASARQAILRGEPTLAREWVNDPALHVLGDRTELHLLGALAQGYLGATEAALESVGRAEAAQSTSSEPAGLETRALLQWIRTILGDDGDRDELSALVLQAREAEDRAALATAQLTAGLVEMRGGHYDAARGLLLEAWHAGHEVSTMCDLDIRTNLALADVYSSAPVDEVAATLAFVSQDLAPGSLAALALRASEAQVSHMSGDFARAHDQLGSLLPEFREREILSGVSQLHGLEAWMYVREGRLPQAVRSWREQYAILAGASADAALPVAGLIDVATWRSSDDVRAPRAWEPVGHLESLTACLVDAVSTPVAQAKPLLQAVVSGLHQGISLGAHHETILLAAHVARELQADDVHRGLEERVALIRTRRGDRGITLPRG